MVRGDLYSEFFFYIIKLFRYVNIINLKNKKNYFKIKNTLKNNPYYIFKQTQNLIHIERINLNWSNFFLNHLNKYSFDK